MHAHNTSYNWETTIHKTLNWWLINKFISVRMEKSTEMPKNNNNKSFAKIHKPNTSHFNQFQSSEFRSHHIEWIVTLFPFDSVCRSRNVDTFTCVHQFNVCVNTCSFFWAFCKIHCVYTEIRHGSWFASIKVFFMHCVFHRHKIAATIVCPCTWTANIIGTHKCGLDTQWNTMYSK